MFEIWTACRGLLIGYQVLAIRESSQGDVSASAERLVDCDGWWRKKQPTFQLFGRVPTVVLPKIWQYLRTTS